MVSSISLRQPIAQKYFLDLVKFSSSKRSFTFLVELVQWVATSSNLPSILRRRVRISCGVSESGWSGLLGNGLETKVNSGDSEVFSAREPKGKMGAVDLEAHILLNVTVWDWRYGQSRIYGVRYIYETRK
jgi:hypothetical protein